MDHSKRGWLLAWRDICSSLDERTVIASAIPLVAVGHSMPLVFSDHPQKMALLGASLSSFRA